MTRLAAAALVLLAACSRRAPIETCAADLSGAYTSDTGEHWMILDSGTGLEIYPLFDDTRPPGAPPGHEVGPRAIDLARTAQGADGDAKRRFGLRGEFCIAIAPVHLLACRDDTLELVLADPTPPASVVPCAPSRAAQTHRERWHHD